MNSITDDNAQIEGYTMQYYGAAILPYVGVDINHTLPEISLLLFPSNFVNRIR